MDDAHQPCAPGQGGSLMIQLPLPPGSLVTLWQADQRMVDTYLSEMPGYYKTADAGFIDADGYVYVMSRTDDVINVAGHRLSTGAIEEVLASHPAVAECAVIGVDDALKGQLPLGFLVLKAGVGTDPGQVAREAVALVREEIGPVACFKLAAAVARLPKTRSGKILRGTMQKIANGEPYTVPPTIDDPQILTEIAEVLAAIGFPRTEDEEPIPVSGCS
jgi:propionyl-CoA synthetase